MKPVLVKTNTKSYPVYIGNNVLKALPELILNNNLPTRVFVVLDRKIDRIYGTSIKKVMNTFSKKISYLSLAASEKNKSLRTANQIYNKLIKEKFGRDTVLIIIGGGTIGDVAGYVASTYMRGIPFIQIPTTLLSAVDSSIGGKTGVNHQETKNIIGTFYHPELVLIDTNFLKSLPQKEIISGFGEVIKYSYLTDQKFYSILLLNYTLVMKKYPDFLNKIIYECVKIKSAVVSKDEKEKSGLRRILNFGHTFAHAFESSTSYKLSHGKAVIAGIATALILSFEKKLIDESQLKYMLELPMKFKSSINLKNHNAETILKKMTYDKKNMGGRIQFVLLKNFGEILVDVPAEKKSVLNALKKREQSWFKRATAGL